jgi:hypothetical protein
MWRSLTAATAAEKAAQPYRADRASVYWKIGLALG